MKGFFLPGRVLCVKHDDFAARRIMAPPNLGHWQQKRYQQRQIQRGFHQKIMGDAYIANLEV